MHAHHATARQLWRYGLTGLTSNGLLYACYLALSTQVKHTVAMTVTYCAGVLCSFVFNRRWTFSHRGHAGAALFRYIAVYALGYVFNLFALSALVDVAGLPHQAAMAALILISAGMIFLAQKYWVFPAADA
jgi:putative flippase GtrA